MNLSTEMAVNQISDVIWKIPPSEKPGMLVPARIYSTEQVLTGMDSGVFEQVTNVACLPGIRQYALCMPDGHWGYGFPIGGVAAFDIRSGVISPGGVGYDVNCLDGNAQVLHELGYRQPIKALDRMWKGKRVMCVNPSVAIQSAEFGAFLSKSATSPVFRVTTKSGRQIIATGDIRFSQKMAWFLYKILLPEMRYLFIHLRGSLMNFLSQKSCWMMRMSWPACIRELRTDLGNA